MRQLQFFLFVVIFIKIVSDRNEKYFKQYRFYSSSDNSFVPPIVFHDTKGTFCQTSAYCPAASFRYSGAYSLLIQSFIPVHESFSLISSKSVVILPKRRYLDFSVAFFHTQEYLFAFASNLDP